MIKKKTSQTKRENPRRKRYKRPILRRVEMKVPSIGFTSPTFEID